MFASSGNSGVETCFTLTIVVRITNFGRKIIVTTATTGWMVLLTSVGLYGICVECWAVARYEYDASSYVSMIGS